jgi:cytochrome c peroxidase
VQCHTGVQWAVKPPIEGPLSAVAMLKIRSVQTPVARLVALFLTLIATEARPAHLGLPTDAPTAPASARELVVLGRQLFNDKRLSLDGTVSCASCHIPERRFTDGLDTARGLHGQRLTRHTPSLLNVRYASSLFWDGRVSDPALQARSPLLAPAEHGLADESAVGAILRADPGYVRAFGQLFGITKEAISIREVGAALAAFERTLLAADSPFDRYQYGGDTRAMNPAAIRGLALFRGRAQCDSCHPIGESAALLTDGEFHSSPLPLPESTLTQLGVLTDRVSSLRGKGEWDALNALIETDQGTAELGRFLVTLDPRDIGRFKTPSLRNVASTGPYMHNGSVRSLPQAVELELYSRTDQRYPLVLTDSEHTDLLEFLQALTSP